MDRKWKIETGLTTFSTLDGRTLLIRKVIRVNPFQSFFITWDNVTEMLGINDCWSLESNYDCQI